MTKTKWERDMGAEGYMQGNDYAHGPWNLSWVERVWGQGKGQGKGGLLVLIYEVGGFEES